MSFSLLALVCLTAALFWLFPGQRLALAFTLATGVRRVTVQRRINAIETQAIGHASLSTDDRAFLSDFYGTLATGAKLSIVVGQTGRLMDHYLAGSGSDYRLDAEIFSQNDKVQAQMSRLRKQAAAAPCTAGAPLASPTFYMPDKSKIDSVFGLYNGLVRLTRSPAVGGTCALHWRAEVPWFWPSYASLQQKYGTPHGESFPLPNLQSILFGQPHALFVDNGLGEYLAEIGLAKPFLAFAEWDEAAPVPS
ncbi:MAG TPA: hypothetical protein VNW92_31115 [Polyangiaceae bacterium]|jgi:hypothetical protein|nr:hypothetical protein [Polyangiaceae bacterium]